MTDRKIDLRLSSYFESSQFLAHMVQFQTAAYKAAADFDAFLIQMEVLGRVPRNTTADFIGRLLSCGYHLNTAQDFIRHHLSMSEDVILISARITREERYWHHDS